MGRSPGVTLAFVLLPAWPGVERRRIGEWKPTDTCDGSCYTDSCGWYPYHNQTVRGRAHVSGPIARRSASR